MEQALVKIPNSRLLLIPASDQTVGHSATEQAKWWKNEVGALVKSAPYIKWKFAVKADLPTELTCFGRWKLLFCWLIHNPKFNWGIHMRVKEILLDVQLVIAQIEVELNGELRTSPTLCALIPAKGNEQEKIIPLNTPDGRPIFMNPENVIRPLQ